MTKLEALEQQIAALDENSFSELREWFIEFDQASVAWMKRPRNPGTGAWTIRSHEPSRIPQSYMRASLKRP
jgi:hypothetical protein